MRKRRPAAADALRRRQRGRGRHSATSSASSSAGARRARQPRSRKKASDLEYGLNIDFWQAIRGTQVRLNITRQEVCDTCHGTGSARRESAVCPECDGTGNVTQMAGAMKFNLTCPRCDGKGRLRTSARLPRRWPASAARKWWKCAFRRARSPVRVCAWRARAMPARMGGPPGDLYITIRVEEASVLQAAKATTFEIQVPITVSEAGLGAKIEVPTIDGRALLKIPQGTQNGQKFRLREKGVFNARKNTRGDEIVEVVIQAPEGAGRAHQGTAARAAQVQPEDPAQGNVEQGVGTDQWQSADPKQRT